MLRNCPAQTLKAGHYSKTLMRNFTEELASLRKQAGTGPRVLAPLWMDKAVLRHWINGRFEELSIQRAPIGAEVVQARMAQAGLAPCELSRGIVSAREE